jgi:excisionase family DNA binding protein
MSICSTGISDPEIAKAARREPLAVTVQEASRITGLSNSTIYELMGAGKLRSEKVAGRRLIFFASLKELLGLVPAE